MEKIQSDYPISKPTYASGHTRAVWVMSLLWLTIAARTLGVASCILSIRFMQQTAEGVEFMDNEIAMVEWGTNLINLLLIVVSVATVIAFLMWIHRAYRNLPALGAENLDYSPGWAVGYFFIPILNLFRPYQVMCEIWRGSDPAKYNTISGRYIRSSSPLVAWWWGLFLIMSLLNRASYRFTSRANTADEFVSACYLSILSGFVAAFAAAAAIIMIRRIDEHQAQRYALTQQQPTPIDASIPDNINVNP